MYKIIVVLASLFAVIHSNPHRSSNSFYRLLTDNPLSITKVLKNYNSRPVHRNSFSSKYSGNGNKKVYTTRRRTYYKKKPARTQYYSTDFPDSHRNTYTTKNEIIRPKTIFKPITKADTLPAPTTTPTPTPASTPAPTPAPKPAPTPAKIPESAPRSASLLRNGNPILDVEDYDYYGDLFGYVNSLIKYQLALHMFSVHIQWLPNICLLIV